MENAFFSWELQMPGVSSTGRIELTSEPKTPEKKKGWGEILRAVGIGLTQAADKIEKEGE